MTFIKGFQSGTIDQQKLDDYRNILLSDPKQAEKELGRVMVILDSTIEQEQSEVLGGFYRALTTAGNWLGAMFYFYSQEGNEEKKLVFKE